MQARFCHHWHFRHHQRAFWGHKVQVAKRTPDSNIDNTQLALMLARGAPFLPIDLHCSPFKPFILTAFEAPSLGQTQPTQRPEMVPCLGLWSCCWRCVRDVPCKNEPPNRVGTSSLRFGSRNGHLKLNVAPSETPSLRLPRHCQPRRHCPRTRSKENFGPASKVFDKHHFCLPRRLNFVRGLWTPCCQTPRPKSLKIPLLNQGVDLTPSAHSDADETPNPKDLDPLTLTALMTLIVGRWRVAIPLGRIAHCNRRHHLLGGQNCQVGQQEEIQGSRRPNLRQHPLDSFGGRVGGFRDNRVAP